jgi:hypothetical protein
LSNGQIILSKKAMVNTENGDYPGTDINMPGVLVTVTPKEYDEISQYADKGETYEIEVHTHPEPTAKGYEDAENTDPILCRYTLYAKNKNFTMFVETSNMQFAVVVEDSKLAKKSTKNEKDFKKVYFEAYANAKGTSQEKTMAAVLAVIGDSKKTGLVLYINVNKNSPKFKRKN